MARRHPHLNGNHLRNHPRGAGAIHPHLKPGDHNSFGGHPGQARFGAEGTPADRMMDSESGNATGLPLPEGSPMDQAMDGGPRAANNLQIPD